MDAAHDRDDPAIRLLRDLCNAKGLPGIGGKERGDTDHIRLRLFNLIPDSALVAPETVILPEKGKRRPPVGAVILLQMGKRMAREDFRLPPGPEIKNRHIRHLPQARPKIEKGKRIGPDGSIVEILNRRLNKKHFHGKEYSMNRRAIPQVLWRERGGL